MTGPLGVFVDKISLDEQYLRNKSDPLIILIYELENGSEMLFSPALASDEKLKRDSTVRSSRIHLSISMNNFDSQLVSFDEENHPENTFHFSQRVLFNKSYSVNLCFLLDRSSC